MDIATLIGIVACFLLLTVAILTGSGVAFFFNLPSALIVFGGAIGATLVNFPLKDVMAVMNVAKNAFLEKTSSTKETIDILVDIAEKARREGILAIERELDNLEDEFIRLGIQYAVDGTEPETIRDILESELASMEERHKQGKKIFDALGTYAPAFGMIGTLIGLIQMLAALDDPSSIGAGMATALVTTLYGAFAANVVFIPIAGKLEYKSRKEAIKKELVIEGILSIQSGDNPRIVADKLKTFLSPAEKGDVEEGEEEL
jgi:chemotaxis protein MotA